MARRVALLLGAGFSAVDGVPVTARLFDERIQVDRAVRRKLAGEVLEGWQAWRKHHDGNLEQYLSDLHLRGLAWGLDADYRKASAYVAMAIALRMRAKMQPYGDEPAPKIVGAHMKRGPSAVHGAFWNSVRKKSESLAVLTTNYDILPERGLGVVPHRGTGKSGFHYGIGQIGLAGTVDSPFRRHEPAVANGPIPLLKLHGSISWSLVDGHIIPWVDCRPALQQKALILAPMTTKEIPDPLLPVWTRAKYALQQADTLLVVGHSLPAYDLALRQLLSDNASSVQDVHSFNPDTEAAVRLEAVLGHKVEAHPGLPDGLAALARVLRR